MPEDKSYRNTIYTNLLDAYGQESLPSFEDFNKKLDTDTKYASTLYANLVDAYGNEELPDLKDFSERLKKKVPALLGAPEEEAFTLGYRTPGAALQKDSTLSSSSASAVSPSVQAFNKKYNTTLTDAQIQGKQEIPASEAANRNAYGGLVSMVAGLVHTPQVLSRMIASPLLSAMGMEDKDKEAFMNYSSGMQPLSASLENVSDKLNQHAQTILKPTAKGLGKQGRRTPDEYFQEGKYLEGAKELGVGLSAFAPVILGMAVSPGTTMASMLGSEHLNVLDNPNMTEDQKLQAAGYGALIDAGAMAAGGKLLKYAAGNLPISQLSKAISTTILNTIKPYAPLSIPLMGYVEGVSFQVAHNLVEKHTDPTKAELPLLEGADNVGKQFMALTLMGPASQAAKAGAALTSEVAHSAKTKKALKEQQANLDAIRKDMENPDVPDETKDILSKKHDELIGDMNDQVLKDQEVLDQTPPETQEQIQDLNHRLNEIDASLDGVSLSEESKNALMDEQKIIHSQIDKLLKDAKILRENEGLLQDEGALRPGSEDQGGQDLQRKEKAGPEAGDGEGLTHEQKTKDNTEASELGFDSAPHAINSVNKRLGKEYKSFAEIPKDELKKVGNDRQGESADATLDEQIADLTAKIDRALTNSRKRELQGKLAIAKNIKADKDPARRKLKAFIQTVKGSAQTTPELVEKTKEQEQFYKAITNQESIDKADKVIAEDPDTAKEKVLSDAPASGDKSALAVRLMKHYEKQGNYAAAIEVLDSYDKQLREAGRFIQAASLWNKLSPETVTRIAKRYVKDLSEQDQQKIFERMSEINKMDEGAQKDEATLEVLDYIASLKPFTAMDLLDAYRYQNMLSNPRSHERNIYGNLLNMMLTEPMVIGTKATFDYLKDPYNPAAREAKFSQIPDYYKSIYNNIPRAFMAARETFKNGYVADKILDLPNATTMIESLRRTKLPKGLTVVMRFLEAQDRFVSVLISQGEKARLMKAGVEEGVASEKANKLAEDYLYREKLDASDKTRAHAVRALDAVGQGINYMRRVPYLGKPLSWFAPFVSTPINVAKLQLKFSPLGFVGGSKSKNQIAQAALGSAIMGIGATMAMQEMTTWAPPTDPDEKENFYASGRKPYSVKIGNAWVPMQYFGPFALAFALPASLKHYTTQTNTALTDSEAKKVSMAIMGMSGYILSQTAFTGLEGFSNLLQGDPETSIGKEAGRLTQQIIPLSGLVRYVNTFIDPVYRKSKGYVESIESGLPGLSKDLEPYTKPYRDSDLKKLPLPPKEQSERSIINNFLPYDIGINDEEFGIMLTNRRLVRQKNHLAKKQGELTAEGKKVQQELERRNKEKSEESRIKKQKELERLDKVYRTTLEEKELRTVTNNPTVGQVPFVIQKLYELPSTKRKPTLMRWLHVGIVTDDNYNQIRISPRGDISLR